MKDLFILHDFDGKKYFSFLEKKYNVYYYSSNPVWLLFSSLIKRRKIDFQQIKSIIFFFKSFFIRDKNIIIGMAPGTIRILLYKHLIKRNRIFYHTSWVYYNVNKFLHKPIFFRKTIYNEWHKFIKHDKLNTITVTQYGKKQLINFGAKSVNNISHSFETHTILKRSENPINNEIINLLFIGRLVEEKGIKIAVSITNKLNKISQKKYILNILGEGPLEKWVKNNINEKIRYHGYLSGSEKENIFNKSHFLLLPSFKTKSWEELFGVVIIEAMSHGIPCIATNNVGPSEIIQKNTGVIFEETKYHNSAIEYLSNIDENTYRKLQYNNILEYEKYSEANIVKKWEKILD